ncbi:MAG: magnesium transporter, partial [Spirochaetia bacterium]|nr:magnesium transporter [Spirochaetia bacterium]
MKEVRKKEQNIHNNPSVLEWDGLHEKIKNREEEIVSELILVSHPADLAEMMERMDLEDSIFLFRKCEFEYQRKIFVELSDELKSILAENLSLQEISRIIEDLASDEVTYLLSDLDKSTAEVLLNAIEKEESDKIRTQLNFDENSAGRLMNLEFAVVRDTDNARKAIQVLRKIAKEIDDIYVIYVTDKLGILKGLVHLKDLIIANPRTSVGRLTKPVQSFHYSTDQEEVAFTFKKYNLVSAPVVDDNDKIIGRITVDDVLDIVEEEATEDILRMAGVSEEETFTSSIWESVKGRMLWLVINLAIAMLTTSVVTIFEDTILRIVVLASLMPIVAGMGGNAGTQAITVMVRGLATGELNDYNWGSAIRKEMILGFTNGLVVGSVTIIVTYILKRDINISGVIGLAMLINLTLAGFVGSSVPMLLKFLKIDPA